MLSSKEKMELVSDALSSFGINEEVLEKSKKSCDMMFTELSNILEFQDSCLDRVGRCAINSALDYISKLEKNNEVLHGLVLEFGSGVSFENAEEMKKLINKLLRN